MFIERPVYARNGKERKEKRVLTIGWARVCEFLKTEFDSPSESQIRFIGLSKQQSEAVIQKVNLVTKQKMDSVGEKNRLSEDDGASISPGLSPSSAFFLRNKPESPSGIH